MNCRTVLRSEASSSIGPGSVICDDGDYNRTYAADGKWGIGRNSLVSGFVAKTDTPEAGRSRLLLQPARPRAVSEMGSRPQYQEVGDAFNPEVGFLTRRGYRKPDVRVMTRFRPKDFMKLQEVRPHATYRGFWGYDGFQETGYSHLDNHWQFRNSSEVHTGMNLTREGLRVPFEIFPGIFVPPGTYDNAEAQLVFMTNQGAPVSLNLQTFMGGFFSGDRVTLNPTFRVRPSEIFQMEVAYSWNNVNLPQGDFETNLVRTVWYSFNPRVFTQALVQYNDRADVWSMNLRFAWLQAANTGLFVVYNDSRGLYDLFPDRPERTDRSITISCLADVRRPAVTVHTIATTTHGRYLVEAAAGDAVGVLVGFHGQAETAAIELDHLRTIRGDRPWTLVSVQGLHRYYTRRATSSRRG